MKETTTKTEIGAVRRSSSLGSLARTLKEDGKRYVLYVQSTADVWFVLVYDIWLVKQSKIDV